MYKHMIQFLDRPDLYQKTEAAFWDDERILKGQAGSWNLSNGRQRGSGK